MRYGAFQTHFGGPGFRRAQQPQQPQQPASPMAQLLQFVPIILLLLWTFMQMPSAPVRAPQSAALHHSVQALHRLCSCMGATHLRGPLSSGLHVCICIQLFMLQ